MYYRSANPDHPWLTPCAIQVLGSYLKPSDTGLEFGSGRSTLWFSRHVGHLTSVEHDEQWHAKVAGMLRDANRSNVTYHFRPKDRPDDQAVDAQYVSALAAFPPESVDFVLVDGVYRDWCALGALDVLRPGGILIIDNVNWFLPNRSWSPNSRRPEEGPHGKRWAQVSERLANWRTIWTSCGVFDTAIFFKPAAGPADQT